MKKRLQNYLIKNKYECARIGLFILLALIYAHPVLTDLWTWGQMDWDQFTFWNAVPRETMLKFRQFPFWNPYASGGSVLLAHPHSSFLSPVYVFVMIFGPVVGLKLEIICHLVIGLWGMFLLARHLKLNRYSCYLASFVYMFNSIYALHVTEGHASWMVMAFFPWVFRFYLKSLECPIKILGAAGFLGLMIFGGSVDVFHVVIVFLTVYALLKFLQTRQFKFLGNLALIYAATIVLCGIKLVPMLEFLYFNPRIAESASGADFAILQKMLFGREQNYLYASNFQGNALKEMGLTVGWHEYGAYVGLTPIILYLYGVLTGWKKHWPLVISGFVSLMITAGDAFFVDFWSALQHVPPFGSLSVPSRFIVGFIFSIALLSGFGLSRLEQSSIKKHSTRCLKRGPLFAVLICLYVMVDLFAVNIPIFKRAFGIWPQEITRIDHFQQRFKEGDALRYFSGDSLQGRIVYSAMYPAFLSNSGVLDGYEVVNVKKGDVKVVSDPDYRGEAYLERSMGQAVIRHFSPNQINLEVHSIEEDKLVINQNYFRGWNARIDGLRIPVEPVRGLVAVSVPSGHHSITFSYFPKSFLLGLLMTLSALIVCWKILFGDPGEGKF